jgi:hypothetical protein
MAGCGDCPRLAQEVRLLRERHARDIWFVGKTRWWPRLGSGLWGHFPRKSAGSRATQHSLIHGRRMTKDLTSKGRWEVAGACWKR